MVLKLYMENQSRKKQNKWWFTLNNTNEIVARAVNGANMHTYLWYGKKKYQFNGIPRIISKKELSFRYPYSSKIKKTLGFKIFENNSFVAELHSDALRCKERGKDKYIGVDIFHFDGEVYLLFHVGLPKHNSSYFCLYKDDGELIAIIARHHTSKEDDNCKATLYIERDENILITLFACTSQIIDVINFWDDGENYDPSAGAIVSKLQAERELYDSEFIERVKEKNSQEVLILPLEIPEADIKLATETLDWEKEEQKGMKISSRFKMGLLFLVIIFITTIILKIFGIDLVFYF